MPSSSIFLTSVASVYRGGGARNFCRGSMSNGASTAPLAKSGSTWSPSSRGVPLIR